MKKLILLLAVITSCAFGQGVRFDSYNVTSAKNVPVGAQANVMTLPYSTVTVCLFNNDLTPCTSFASIFSDQVLTQVITQPLQSDSQGRFGFWIAAGVYKYSITTAGGTLVGTFPLSLNSPQGPQGPGGIGCGPTNCIIASPTVTQVVTQPSGTTLGVNSLNGNLNASLFSGSDIGAKVNSAIASLLIGCGTVFIPSGSYSQSTTIIKPRCVNILGAGSMSTILNWTGGAGVAIQIKDSSSGIGYPEGQIADLALSGPGALVAGYTAIYIGDTYPATAQWGDHQNLNRVRIINWDIGVRWGSNAWSTTITESLISNNGWSLYFPNMPGSNSGEKITVVGTSLQNSQMAMNLVGFADFYFFGTSIVFNATAGTVNIAHFYGCHFETNRGRMLTVKGAASLSAVEIIGGWFSYSEAGGTDADVFYIDPTADANSMFKIDGMYVNTAHAITNLVSWNISGSNAQLDILHLPFVGGLVANLTNSTCMFLGCHIQEPSLGFFAYTGSASFIHQDGNAGFNTVTSGAGSGAVIGFTSGRGYTAGNGTGYAIYPTGVSGATGIFFNASTINANGKSIAADFYAAGGNNGLTSTVTISGCTITFTGGLVTAKSGTC